MLLALLALRAALASSLAFLFSSLEVLASPRYVRVEGVSSAAAAEEEGGESAALSSLLLPPEELISGVAAELTWRCSSLEEEGREMAVVCLFINQRGQGFKQTKKSNLLAKLNL